MQHSLSCCGEHCCKTAVHLHCTIILRASPNACWYTCCCEWKRSRHPLLIPKPGAAQGVMRVACLFDGTAWALVMPEHLYALGAARLTTNGAGHAALLDAYAQPPASCASIPDDGYIMQVSPGPRMRVRDSTAGSPHYFEVYMLVACACACNSCAVQSLAFPEWCSAGLRSLCIHISVLTHDPTGFSKQWCLYGHACHGHMYIQEELN